jgi:hypothetical protein
VWGYHSNVTTLAELACEAPSGAAPPPPAPPPCGPLLARPEWLAPPRDGRDARTAALLMALARDAYPKTFGLPDGRAYRCAWARKLRTLGASNVTFVQDKLMNAAVAVAGPHVLLVIRGTDSELEKGNNGEWASAGARLWLRGVRVHGGFLVTARHVLPTVVRLLQEAMEQAAAAAGGGAVAAGEQAQEREAFAQELEQQQQQQGEEDEEEEGEQELRAGNATAVAVEAGTPGAAGNGTALALPPLLDAAARQRALLAAAGAAAAATAGEPPLLSLASAAQHARAAVGAVAGAAAGAQATLRAMAAPGDLGMPPKIFLAGHSRGGGLVTVLAALLASAYPKSIGRHLAGVYTFGAPKVGNKGFVEQYASRLGRITYAWWNELDNIPLLPPQVRGGRRGEVVGQAVGGSGAAACMGEQPAAMGSGERLARCVAIPPIGALERPPQCGAAPLRTPPAPPRRAPGPSAPGVAGVPPPAA